MNWIDAHDATLARHGGRLPTADEAQVGDVGVPGLSWHDEDRRWWVTRQRDADDAPWSVWDARHMSETRRPVLVVSGLREQADAFGVAERFAASRLLRVAHAVLVVAARAVREGTAFVRLRFVDDVARAWSDPE